MVGGGILACSFGLYLSMKSTATSGSRSGAEGAAEWAPRLRWKPAKPTQGQGVRDTRDGGIGEGVVLQGKGTGRGTSAGGRGARSGREHGDSSRKERVTLTPVARQRYGDTGKLRQLNGSKGSGPERRRWRSPMMASGECSFDSTTAGESVENSGSSGERRKGSGRVVLQPRPGYADRPTPVTMHVGRSSQQGGKWSNFRGSVGDGTVSYEGAKATKGKGRGDYWSQDHKSNSDGLVVRKEGGSGWEVDGDTRGRVEDWSYSSWTSTKWEQQESTEVYLGPKWGEESSTVRTIFYDCNMPPPGVSKNAKFFHDPPGTYAMLDSGEGMVSKAWHSYGDKSEGEGLSFEAR